MKQTTIWAYRFNSTLWSGLDVLFPPVCAGCSKRGQRWCEDCQQKVIPIPEPLYEVFGLPQPENGICKKCQTSRSAYHALRSWFVFEQPMRGTLLQQKVGRISTCVKRWQTCSLVFQPF